MRQTPHSLQMHEIEILSGKGLIIRKPVEMRKEDIALPNRVITRIQRTIEKRDVETP